jgi:Family of unknown function (DUF6297)
VIRDSVPRLRSALPTAAQARRQLRAIRARRRSTRQRLIDRTDALIYAGMITALTISAARAALPDAGQEVGQLSQSLLLWQWITVLLSILAGALLLKVLLAFGPVLARESEQHWLLSSPIDRQDLLLTRFTVLLGVAVLSGCAMAVLFLVLIRSSALAATLPAGALLGVAIAALAVTLQPRVARVRIAHVATTWVVVGCFVAAGVLLMIRPTLPAISVIAEDRMAGQAMLVALTVCAAAFVYRAYQSLARLGRAVLSVGSELALALTVATTFLDSTIFTSIMTLRRTRAIGRVRSARLRGGRVLVLIRADWRRVCRMWRSSAVWAALLPVPYAAQLVASSGVLLALHVVAAFFATASLAGGLRFVCRSAAIRRSIGGTDRQIRSAHLVIPTIGTITWCALTFPALPHQSIIAALISAFGAVVVTYRIATKPPMYYSSPIIDIGAGSIPIGLILQLSRGPALLLIIIWLQLTIGA